MTDCDKLIGQIYGALESAGKLNTLAHSKNVCRKALELCEKPELTGKARLACALHDISVIIPREKWLDTCVEKGIEITEEEKKVPLLIHQKLSAYIAGERFHVTDAEVLSAVACHTTLKPDASYLDMLLFVADKIAWDGEGAPPWLAAVNCGLTESLELAAYNYMAYMMDHNLLLIVHPDFLEAYNQLENQLKR